MTTAPLDTRPFLILCEGESDKRFFDQLIEKRGIENCFQVRFPSQGDDKRAGRSKFGRWLDLVSDTEDFIQNIQAVLIVSDNDENPKGSFEEVIKSLQEASSFKLPTKEREVMLSQDAPALAILMLPLDAQGNLEGLCLAAAYTKWPIKEAVDNFTSATSAKNWSAGKKSKMQLQCIIAATCASRPDAGFVGHWRDKKEFHVPLEDPTFDGIAEFLKNFRAMLKSASADPAAVPATRSA
jgi:hypothetical protein